MTISCSQCGSSFPDEFNFCLPCGKRLKEVASPLPPQPPTNPEPEPKSPYQGLMINPIADDSYYFGLRPEAQPLPRKSHRRTRYLLLAAVVVIVVIVLIVLIATR